MTSHLTIRYKSLLKVQGIYYLITGIWPLVSMKTFLIVTGPKTDLWLVLVVGSLIFINGATFLFSALFQKRNIAIALLAAAMALALAVLEIIFYVKGIISAVYLLDSGLELCVFILWIVLFRINNEARFKKRINEL